MNAAQILYSEAINSDAPSAIIAPISATVGLDGLRGAFI